METFHPRAVRRSGKDGQAVVSSRSTHPCGHPGVHFERVAHRLPDWIPDLHPIFDRGYGGRERVDVDGHDVIAAGGDFAAVQIDSLCLGGRLVSRRRIDGEKFPLKKKARGERQGARGRN